jgi:hypothetical protein
MKGKRDMAFRSVSLEHTLFPDDEKECEDTADAIRVLEQLFQSAAPSDRTVARVIRILARYVRPEITQKNADIETLLAVSIVLSRNGSKEP